MATDNFIEIIRKDQETDPSLQKAAYDSVEELAGKVMDTHRKLLADEDTICGYLYRQAIKKIRKLEGR